MNTPIRTGVLGYGLAGRHFHVPFIRALGEFELRAVATSRAEARAHLPGVRVVPQAEDIFNADDIDLVIVATPHRLHVSQTLAALAAGKHVVVEKPVAANTADIETLKQASLSARKMVIPFQNRRWDGDFMTVQKLIRSGMLGIVHHFETHWPMFRPQPRGVWRDTPDEMGGILNDLGPHLIDQTLMLFGMPAAVEAQIMTHRPGYAVDDAFRIQMHYASGLYALLETDVLNGGTVPRYTIRGTNGTFEKFGVDPQEASLRASIFPGHPEWGTQSEKGQVVLGGAHGLSIRGELEIPAGDYRQYYAAVARAINGMEALPVTLDEVLQQMKILEAIRQSDRDGGQVNMETR